ncbi:Glutaminase A [Hyphodiscus hymeniophilus]|uniref:Glutaminase A n=1 Tax=Hyphodiscus hymeniophilus TaxID=353542 RepID=A0A9P7AY28_9HELO|nr:Glutaminase A [Hyphodiscus hymeniophilus]
MKRNLWQIPIFAPFELRLAPPTAVVDHTLYSPVLPPSYPLAAAAAKIDKSTAWIPGNQVSNLPSVRPEFWTGSTLNWGVLARVDSTVYKVFGVPSYVPGSKSASLRRAQYTSTHSIFTLEAGKATVELDFFSPVSPKNYLRQSLPFSYLTVSVSGTAESSVQVYSDIDENWTGQSGNTISEFSTANGVSLFELSVDGATTYEEVNDMALWGDVVFASRPSNSSSVTQQSGLPSSVRAQFASNGTLDGVTSRFSAGDVVGIAHDLGQAGGSVTFAIGYVREAAVNYLANSRTGYYRASYPETPSAVSYFFDDYPAAQAESLIMDAELEQKAVAAAGTNYSDILTLTTRQVFGGSDLTIPGDSLDTGDVMVFLKEISSDGNVNTLDVIFPAFPIWYVMAPEYIRLLLEPIVQYLATGLWTKPFAIHDIGTHYPYATGHDDQKEEDMPVEESGNLILLVYAYVAATGNKAWAVQHHTLLQKYAEYLIVDGLDESVQLATNDCCGPLANQTNLAIKAAVALNAYGKLFDDTSYSLKGLEFADELYEKGIALDEARTHFKLQYGNDVKYNKDIDYAVVFNIYPDILFTLQTFPESAHDMLASFYPTIHGPAGIALDSRVDWSSTFWTSWAGAASPGKNDTTRNLFVDDVWGYMTNGINTPPFSDRWFAIPGSGGLVGGSGDPVGGFDAWRNRPVVGGHFAVLALKGPDQFK